MHKSQINKRKKKENNKNVTKKYKHKRTKRTKRTKKTIGGIRIYTTDGEFTSDPNILYKGKDFFRKMTNDSLEIEICKLLIKHPHKNIIKIYGIGANFIDMELLNTDINEEYISDIKNIMQDVKTYLQNLGIIYIDWKLDNIGISADGQYKLFDFDASGLIDIETNEWLIEPPKYWSYNKAIENGMETPNDIDNYAFDLGLI